MVSTKKEEELPQARQKEVRKWEKSVPELLKLLLPDACMGSGAPEPVAEPPQCTAGNAKVPCPGR